MDARANKGTGARAAHTLRDESPTAPLRAIPDDLLIRPRVDADSRALFELFVGDSFQRFGTGMPPFAAVEDMLIWLNGLSKNRFEPVATVGGRVVGMGGLYIADGRHSHMGSLFLGVKEEFQGRGIGSALLTTLLATADFLIGLHRVQLNVFSDNQPALGLYRKFGFKVEGRHRDFLQRESGYVDAYTMARIRSAALDGAQTAEANARIQHALSLLRPRGGGKNDGVVSFPTWRRCNRSGWPLEDKANQFEPPRDRL